MRRTLARAARFAVEGESSHAPVAITKKNRVSANLAVRAVVFDMTMLSAQPLQKPAPPPAAAAPAAAAAPEPSVPTTADAFRSFLGLTPPAAEPAAPPPPRKSAGKKKDPELDIRSKYAQKIAARLGAGDGASGTSLEAVSARRERVDADLTSGKDAGSLAFARTAARAQDSAKASEALSWAWGMPGIVDVLMYVTGRSMAIGLLSRAGDSPAQVGGMVDQLKGVLVDEVAPAPAAATGHTRESAAAALRLLAAKMELDPKQVLVVAGDDAVLGGGRDVGLLTARYKPRGGRDGNVTTDYDVGAIDGVPDVVNGLNGISFRGVSGGSMSVAERFNRL